MVKILVVSDSHGDNQILQTLYDHYRGQVDLFCHAGDSELAADNPLTKKFLLVRGNMDFEDGFADYQLKMVSGKKIFLTHGHLYGVNFDLTKLLLAAQEQEAQIAIYGHTHQLNAVFEKNVLLVNPGSISQPRGQYANIGGTYAIITVDVESNHYEVQFYDRHLQTVPELSFNFN